MSWGRGVSNEGDSLKRSQRLALQSADMTDLSAEITLRVVQHPDPQIILTNNPNIPTKNENNKEQEEESNVDYSYDPCVYLHSDDIARFHATDTSTSKTTVSQMNHINKPLFIHVRSFPKMVVRVKKNDMVTVGHVYMSEMTASNLEVTNRDLFPFRTFLTADIKPLRMIHIEVRPRHINTTQKDEEKKKENQEEQDSDDDDDDDDDNDNDDAESSGKNTTSTVDHSNAVLHINAKEVRDAVVSLLFNTIVTQYERLLLKYTTTTNNTTHPMSTDLILTINDMKLDAWSNVEGAPTLVPDDCYRGYVTPSTTICITSQDTQAVTYIVTNPLPPIIILDEEMSALCVTVDVLDDEEEFVVRRRLLTPCLTFTKWVMCGKGTKYKHISYNEHAIVSGVGALCFDRVLLYLESVLLGNGPNHEFDLEYTQEMLSAAKLLQIKCLEELCLKKLGEFQSRVRQTYIRWEEVVRRNGIYGGSLIDPNPSSETLLLIGGSIYDVTRWLPEHPGGNSIIPKQAVNKDATVFFELYHASRKSFIYLEQFYIGELHPADILKVPVTGMKRRGVVATPSSGFVKTLKEYTTWRVVPKEVVHKSF